MTHSAIVITKDRPREAAASLAMLAAQDVPPDEIILVDASERDVTFAPSPDAQSSQAPRVTMLRAASNISGQKNAGLAAATGDIVSFFDDDVLLPADYCGAVLRRFADDVEGRIGGIAGLPLNQPKAVWPFLLYRKVFLLQTDRGRGRFRLSGFPDFGCDFETESEVEFLASTAVSFRRSAIGDTRFDEGLTGPAIGLTTGRGFAEDVEFSNAVARTHSLRVLPSLRFRHDPSPANREGTEITQALYVHAMRRVSAAHAAGPLRRLARLWALAGQGGLCLMQTVWYRDAGYVRGYWKAMRHS
ncbi:MAG: glycosyltransferase [Ignavibacteria bacterium]|nr:glycosyltransferase [Ignavibacteria bacterium]